MVFVHEVRVNNIPAVLEYKIGKYAADNTKLIQNSSPQDIWFHMEKSASAHVVISTTFTLNKKQLNTVIRWGGILCKKYSHVTKPACIMYTKIENVNITNIPGTVNVGKKKYKTIIV